jgi:hypothetical protein
MNERCIFIIYEVLSPEIFDATKVMLLPKDHTVLVRHLVNAQHSASHRQPLQFKLENY